MGEMNFYDAEYGIKHEQKRLGNLKPRWIGQPLGKELEDLIEPLQPEANISG